MLLGPVDLLAGDGDFVELVEGLGGVLGDLLGGAGLGDLAEVVVDGAHDAGLLPGLTLGGLGAGLVGLPAAFGEDPAGAAGGLDEEDVGAGLVQGDHAGDEAFSGVAVA